MSQANLEYAEYLDRHQPARNPVGWLINCAEKRAINLLDRETRQPTTTPLEAVFHLPDESLPNPEQEVIRQSRQDRLRDALAVLPDKERKLLALVYYEDYSIREAGQALGWQKSAADRHHNRAMDKLRALVGDRDLLSPATLGLAAWIAAYGDRGRIGALVDRALRPGREAVARVLEAGDHLGDLLRRFAPAGEQAGAAASGGAGRVVGACGVAAASVVCGLIVGGSIPGKDAAVGPATPLPAPPSSALPAFSSVPVVPAGRPSVSSQPAQPASEQSRSSGSKLSTARQRPAPSRERSAPTVPTTTETEPRHHEEVVGSVGIEREDVEPAPTPSAKPAAPVSQDGGSPESGSSTPATPASREFGF